MNTMTELQGTALPTSFTERFKASMRMTVKRMQVPQEAVLEIVTQLSIMFDTGLNLSQALEVLEKQAPTPQLGEFVGHIRRGVENGKPLSQAMATQDWAFSPVALALVRAGEMTGDLGGMLGKVAEFMERDISTRKKVKGALSYPAFMAILATCVVIFLLVNVFPKFAELFGNNQAALPGPTKFFLDLSAFMKGNAAWLFPTLFLGVVGAIFGLKSREGRRMVDPFMLRMPAFGNLVKAVSISRSFHVLGTMMNAGLNVLEALQLASDVAGNHVYVQFWIFTKKNVENGHDISESLMDTPLIPPAEAAMVSLGERSGTLPHVLERITKHHEKKVDAAIKAFVAVIEPAMTIIMGAVVALIVSSLIMPMFSISKALR